MWSKQRAGDNEVAVPGRRRWGRSLLRIVLVVGIFMVGVGVGNGRIAIDTPFAAERNKPVVTGLPETLDYSSVDKLYQSLKANYDGKLTEAQLLDGLKHGLAAATKDPYTVYFTAKEADDFNSQLNNSFSGIGAQLGKDKDGNLEIVAPIEGLPAAKAGLKAKDIIATVNGENTAGMSIDDAVSKIRGKKGTTVKLQIVRNQSQALSFTITRDDIKLPSVKTEILDGDIGLMTVTSFSDDTADLTKKAAEEFKSKQVKAVILDMRNNPGGLLDASIKLSNLWLPSGQTVLEERRGGQVVQTYRSIGGATPLKDIPTVVLINSGSASASEITAGALKDNKAAYIIGEKSYGKGVVQQVICITGQYNSGTQRCPADELKVTTSSWYRPNGQNINHKGINPDKTVKISDADAEADKDPQLDAAKTYLTK